MIRRSNTLIHAQRPTFNPWALSPIDFNEWRRQNDLLRVLVFLSEHLPHFNAWRSHYSITDSDLLLVGPGKLLIRGPILHLATLLKNGQLSRRFVKKKHVVGATIFHQELVMEIKSFLPYFSWLDEKHPSCINRILDPLKVDFRSNGRPYIGSRFELLPLGNCVMPNLIGGGRILDFTNLDHLTLINPIGSSEFCLNYCSALNLSIEGDLAFFSAFETDFWSRPDRVTNGLKLSNGIFQNWSIKRCHLRGIFTNIKMEKWKIDSSEFNPLLENSELIDCMFSYSPYSGYDEFLAQELYSFARRTLVSMGKISEARKYFILEKEAQRQRHLFPRRSFRGQLSEFPRKFPEKMYFYLSNWLEYFYLTFQKLLWGYGEFPSRILLWSILIILGYACFYLYHHESITYMGAVDSVYFSIVTFSTLGYGDFAQKTDLLKMVASSEALLGVSAMGLLIGGFANKTKEY